MPKKIFGLPRPWKPIPQPASSKPTPAKGKYRREFFEPILSRTIELNKLTTEVVFQLHDADGEREIRSCYGDIYKVINALMDYARMLELVCDEWNLGAYHRAVYELQAGNLRSIAKKYQEAIGYDYDAAVAKCEAKKKRTRKDDDIGGDALELTLNHKREKREKGK